MAIFFYFGVAVDSWFEPPHDKTNKMACAPSEDWISLSIRPIWSESSLSAWRKLGSLPTHWAHSEDWSDRAGAHADLSLRWTRSHFVGFVIRRLICMFSAAMFHWWVERPSMRTEQMLSRLRVPCGPNRCYLGCGLSKTGLIPKLSITGRSKVVILLLFITGFVLSKSQNCLLDTNSQFTLWKRC